MDPRNASWWWEIALQGVLGSLVGTLVGAGLAGLVAVWVLKKTLAAERELAANAAERERELAAGAAARERELAQEAATQEAASRLAASAVGVQLVIERMHDDTQAFSEAAAGVHVAATQFVARCASRWPATAAEARRLGLLFLTREVSIDNPAIKETALKDVAAELASLATAWLSSAEQKERDLATVPAARGSSEPEQEAAPET